VDAQRLRLYGGLFGGVVAVSWAAIFIRLAEAPALSISAWRLLLAAAPLAIFALLRRRHELRRLTRGGLALLTLSGVALALHFATWIASLGMTTVASSVTLVSTQPLWVGLLSVVVLREPISRRGAVAILVATCGCAVMSGADLRVSREALVGDAFAVAGAIFGAVYFTIGRAVRDTLSLGGYVAVVYGLGAVVLVVWAVGAGEPMSGFSTQTWVMLLLLAVVPQLIGHSTLNWSLRHLPAPFVSVAVLGEPVISTALAIPILGEQPGALRIAGGAIILLGVSLALQDETRRTRTEGEREALAAV
jgi:drug/metabolite transporter (DMT)-like permease